MNFAMAITLWAILPMLIGMTSAFFKEGRPLAEIWMNTNPFVHVVTILEATVGRLDVDGYRWFYFSHGNVMSVWRSTVWILECAAGYTLLGLLFAWRAKCRFRRRIF
jgi:hypothetical protein